MRMVQKTCYVRGKNSLLQCRNTMSLKEIPTAENFEEKLLCVMALDTSGSMDVRINELNAALQQYIIEVANCPVSSAKLETGIVTFDSTAQIIQDPALVEDLNIPMLTAQGTTDMAGGLNLALDMIENRYKYWKSMGMTGRRAWLVLITDGGQTNEDAQISLINGRIQRLKDNKKVNFLPIAVEGADINELQKISNDKIHKLKGAEFIKLFKWLSLALSSMVNSKKGEAVTFTQKDWTEETVAD